MADLLGFIPDGIVYLVAILSLIGVIIGVLMAPAGNHNYMILLCLAVLIPSLELTGAIDMRNHLQLKLQESEIKVANAMRTAAETTAKTEFVVVEKVQKVRDVQVVVQEKLRDVSVVIDEQCKPTAEMIELLNQGAKTP